MSLASGLEALTSELAIMAWPGEKGAESCGKFLTKRQTMRESGNLDREAPAQAIQIQGIDRANIDSGGLKSKADRLGLSIAAYQQ